MFAKPDWPADTGVQSEAGIVMDMDSGAVLFAQNIHVQLPPASITKLLTALVVAEHASMDEQVTFSHDAVYNVESGSGNKLGLEEGDVLSVKDSLSVMLLQSSNQAANALAEHVAGSREAFADMMNEKAEALGCRESNFENPSGLNDEAQLTSAYDMALIGAAAFSDPEILEICSAKKCHASSHQKSIQKGVPIPLSINWWLQRTEPANTIIRKQWQERQAIPLLQDRPL
mgnify:CR=1 FL=1